MLAPHFHTAWLGSDIPIDYPWISFNLGLDFTRCERLEKKSNGSVYKNAHAKVAAISQILNCTRDFLPESALAQKGIGAPIDYDTSADRS
jgi:hypothetical protein